MNEITIQIASAIQKAVDEWAKRGDYIFGLAGDNKQPPAATDLYLRCVAPFVAQGYDETEVESIVRAACHELEKSNA